MFFIGIDPGTQQTGVAVVDETAVLAVYCVKPHSDGKGRDQVCMMIEALTRFFFPYVGDDIPLPGEGVAVVCAESQEFVHTAKSGKSPGHLALLGPISGACLGLGKALYPNAGLFLPRPSDWKGSVPKQIHQGRVLGRLGWPSKKVGANTTGYAYPLSGFEAVINAEKILKGEWKEVVDAIGLAVHAREQYTTRVARRAAIDAMSADPTVPPAPKKRKKSTRKKAPAAPAPVPQTPAPAQPVEQGTGNVPSPAPA